MDETATTGTPPGTAGGQGQPAQGGPDSPLMGVERSMSRPVSVGLVLLLVVANAIGWLWFVNHQDEQFQMLQSQVADVQVSVPSGAMDPALCWLIGAEAGAAGHGKALVGQVTTSGLDTECVDAVTRGANGYGR
jgi:hypothetical protein